MTSKPLRWGILSSGKIAHDFCLALSILPKEHHQVTHVTARDIGRAKEFADLFGIETYSDSYNKVTEDENVDVVYIATLNNTHKDLSILALNHGKAVLCEKPATMNLKDLNEVLKVAKEKNVFYMEAVWTRCFPIYHDLKLRFCDEELGEPSVLMATFGIENLFKVDRINDKTLGGSVVMDIGIYLLTLADLIFEGHSLVEIKACGHVDNDSGVDRIVGITIKYEGNKIAQLLADGDHKLPNDAQIYCTKGNVNIAAPFWCPEKYTRDGKEFSFPLPKAKRPMNFPNSEGLSFEADHVRDCLQKGLKESPLVSHGTSRRIMGYMDEIRKQVNSTHAL